MDNDTLSIRNGFSKVTSGSQDHSIHLWNANTGQLLHTFMGHTEEVTSVLSEH